MTYKKIAQRLWQLLDDIDTYNDRFRPERSPFNIEVMRRVEERHQYMGSGGHVIKRKLRKKRKEDKEAAQK